MIVVAILLGLVGLAGFILAAWGGILILIEAFRTSILWGLGTLFIPFVGLIFVILYWDEVKRPFLMYLGGLALLFVVGTGSALILPQMVPQDDGFTLESYPDDSTDAGSGDLFAQPTLTPTPFQPTPTFINRSPIPTKTPAPPTATPQPTATPLQTDQAEDHIGQTLEFVLDDGQTFRAVLIRVDATHLTVQRRFGGGNMEYKIAKERLVGFTVVP
jgi:hypothetical protein